MYIAGDIGQEIGSYVIRIKKYGYEGGKSNKNRGSRPAEVAFHNSESFA